MSHEKPSNDPTATASGRQVGDILATVEAQLKQLRALQLNREKEGASLTEREEKVRLAETTLAQEWAKLERQRAESEKLRHSLEADRARWGDHEQKLVRERELEREKMASRTSQLETDRKVLDEHRAGLEETSRSVEKLQVRVKELESALEKAGAESDALTTETIEQLEAVHGERDEMQRELESARGQLRDAREALAKSERAAEGQRGGNEKVKSLKAELQQRTQKLDKQTQELQKRSQELEQQKQDFQKQSQELEQQKQDFQKQSQELQARTQELETRTRELQERTQELEAARKEIDADKAPTEELEAARKEIDAGKERIQALEEQLASGSKEDDGAKAEVQRQLADLRGKAQRLAEVADHMKRRHFRLSKMRTLLKKQRGTGTSQSSVHSERLKVLTRNLEQRRRELVELRQHLALAERKMIRRWSRPRSVSTVGWFLLLAVFSCAAGWMGADQYFPAVVTASVTLDAVTESGDPMHQDDELRWKTWHSTIVQESTFIDLLAKRMYEQQLDGLGTPDQVRMRIERDLRVDDYEPETLTYTLAGTDRKMLVAFLDVLGRTVVTESGKTFRGEPGRAWANIRDDRPDGQTRYAILGDVPVNDERLRYAGPIAGVIFAVLLMFIGMAYTKLVRAKREFDDGGDMFGDLPADDHLLRAA